MLVQLLVSVSSPTLRDRISRLSGDEVRIATTEPSINPSEALNGHAPDVVLVDCEWLGSDPGARIAELRAGSRPADVLCVVTDEGPDRRAELLGFGCMAVIDGRAGDEVFHRAVLGQLGKWRKDAIARLKADSEREELRLGDFFTASPTMKKFIQTARRVGSSDTSVLFLGETGVGKERLASAIHAMGPRKDNPMVVVNCGAIPESLLESELFGHERGAFTGAERAHRGYFELAHGGTILLDEIGEVPVHLQVKLLRVLQEQEVRRVGSEKPISIDVRVMAATNRDLQEEMANKRFRSDLFYRLSVVTLTIPPLRERTEDISPLVREYLERFAKKLRADVRGVSPDAMQALTAYHWPGNVREVINVMERAVLLTNTDEITIADLPETIACCYLPQELEPLVDEAAGVVPQLDSSWFRLPLRDARHAWNAAFEKLYLQQVLREQGGKVAQTAAQIGIDPRSLYAKMRAFGLRKEDFR
jgi:DNA-binding NtrC family response regulator